MSRIVAVAGVTAALLVAGCTSTIDGTPTASGDGVPSSAPAGPPPDPPDEHGADVEARRLGAYVVDPETLIDGAKTDDCGFSGPIGPAEDLDLFLGDAKQSYFADAGYAAGFFTCFPVSDVGVQCTVGAAELYDAAHAEVLASRLALADLSPTAERVTIPDLPDAVVVQRTGAGNPTVKVYLQRDRLLSYVDCLAQAGQQATIEDTSEAATTLIKAQDESLGRFAPTPYDEIGQLEDDPYGLAEKTYDPLGNPQPGTEGGYDLEMYRWYATNPDVEIPLLQGNGFTELYVTTNYLNTTDATPEDPAGFRLVNLFQLKDRGSARQVYRGQLQVGADDSPGYRRVSLPNYPDTTCLVGVWLNKVDQSSFTFAGRYAIQVRTWGVAQRTGDLTHVTKLLDHQLALTPR